MPGDALAALLPEGVELEQHDGDAWLAVTPFCVTAFRLRGLLPLPLVSSFLETNVRTYVSRDGKPGIWFFSLDAGSQAIVEAAKLAYRLPYHHARIHLERRDGWIHYRSERTGAALDVSYRPAGDPVPPEPGTLEHFLAERYCLYTEHEGAIHRAEIHHAPWPLRPAEAELRENTMSPLALEGEPLLHYSERQDVVIWPLEPA